MKTIKFYLLSFSIFLFASCQKESVEIIQDTSAQNITTTSPLGNLIARVSQNPTSQDNVLDHSSCFSVQLPVTVIVNNQQIVVTTAADYQIVQNAINAFTNDDDLINFTYPITIKYQNFQTRVIANPSQLHDAVERCGEDNDDLDEIDCIKINYPISFKIYNASNQVASLTTINSNLELFNFFKNLPNNVLIAVNYPISVTNQNGQVVTINNNAELENIIENGISGCHNGNNGGNNNPLLTTIITTGTWKVSYLSNNSSDHTASYDGYNFTFNTNGSSIAVKNTTNINGTWSTRLDSGQTKLILSFTGSTLDELENDWKVIEFTTTTIRLRHGGGSNSSDYLYLIKN
jgi:hypothetical protein